MLHLHLNKMSPTETLYCATHLYTIYPLHWIPITVRICLNEARRLEAFSPDIPLQGEQTVRQGESTHTNTVTSHIGIHINTVGQPMRGQHTNTVTSHIGIHITTVGQPMRGQHTNTVTSHIGIHITTVGQPMRGQHTNTVTSHIVIQLQWYNPRAVKTHYYNYSGRKN